MHHIRWLALLPALAALAAVSALAQQPAAPQKPYTAVPVTLPQGFADPGLEAFRKELAAVAKGRIYAELTRLVAGHGFFWERDFANAFERRRPAVDNLAAALRLEHRDGSGWRTLAAYAAEPSAAALPARPGVVCAPAPPAYDGAELDRLLDDTRSKAGEWLYPRADGTPVRVAARGNAAVSERLGLHFVRVLAAAPKDGEPGAGWIRVATPAGKTGFVAADALMSLGAARLCYGQDTMGRWHLVGFIGEE